MEQGEGRTFRASMSAGAMIRGQIRGYLENAKAECKGLGITAEVVEAKSFLQSEFTFWAYNLSDVQYLGITHAFEKWSQKLRDFANSED